MASTSGNQAEGAAANDAPGFTLSNSITELIKSLCALMKCPPDPHLALDYIIDSLKMQQDNAKVTHEQLVARPAEWQLLEDDIRQQIFELELTRDVLSVFQLCTIFSDAEENSQ